MKSKTHLIILFVVSILCIVMIFGRFMIPNTFTTIISFPFVQISGFLRNLSLSSENGNILAIILYILFSFSPWVLLVITRKKRKLEDLLIVLLPFVLLYVLYQMINPSTLFLYNNLAMNQAILSLLIYSIIFSYLIIKAVQQFCANTTKLINYLLIVFVVVNIMLVLQIFYKGLFDVNQAFKAMQIDNSGNMHLFRINYLFIGFRFIVSNLPLFLNVIIVYFGCEVLVQLKETGYSLKTLSEANKLSAVCKRSLILILFANIFFQIIQLVFAKSLFTVNSTFDFPIFSILFIAVCILVTNLIKENNTLKEENESFI